MQGQKLRPRKRGRVSKGVRNRRHARGSLKELRPGKAALRPSVSFPWETNSETEVAEHCEGIQEATSCPASGAGEKQKNGWELKIEQDTPDIPTLLTSSKIKAGSRAKREAKDLGR